MKTLRQSKCWQVPETVELSREALLLYVFITLNQIQLQKVFLLKFETLGLFVKILPADY